MDSVISIFSLPISLIDDVAPHPTMVTFRYDSTSHSSVESATQIFCGCLDILEEPCSNLQRVSLDEVDVFFTKYKNKKSTAMGHIGIILSTISDIYLFFPLIRELRLNWTGVLETFIIDNIPTSISTTGSASDDKEYLFRTLDIHTHIHSHTGSTSGIDPNVFTDLDVDLKVLVASGGTVRSTRLVMMARQAGVRVVYIPSPVSIPNHSSSSLSRQQEATAIITADLVFMFVSDSSESRHLTRSGLVPINKVVHLGTGSLLSETVDWMITSQSQSSSDIIAMDILLPFDYHTQPFVMISCIHHHHHRDAESVNGNGNGDGIPHSYSRLISVDTTLIVTATLSIANRFRHLDLRIVLVGGDALAPDALTWLQESLREKGLDNNHNNNNVFLLPSCSYLVAVNVLRHASLLVSHEGSLDFEARHMHIPVQTLSLYSTNGLSSTSISRKISNVLTGVESKLMEKVAVDIVKEEEEEVGIHHNGETVSASHETKSSHMAPSRAILCRMMSMSLFFPVLRRTSENQHHHHNHRHWETLCGDNYNGKNDGDTPSTSDTDTGPRQGQGQGTISVILTQFKRNTTELQLHAMFRQSVIDRVKHIILYQDKEYLDVRGILDNMKTHIPPSLRRRIHIIQSRSRNFKYHGRFAVPLLLDSDFTAIIDDDTIPGSHWLESVTGACERYDAVAGPQGLVIHRDKQYMVAPPTDYDMEVDYLGRTWVVRTEWIRLFWSERVPSWECCEDVSVSAVAWMLGRYRSVVPAQPLSRPELWGDTDGRFHHDGNHTYKNIIPLQIRWPLTRHWLASGWVPVVLRETLPILPPLSVCSDPFPIGCRFAYEYTFSELSQRNQSSSLSFFVTGTELRQFGMILQYDYNRLDICHFFRPWVERYYETTLETIAIESGCDMDSTTSSNSSHVETNGLPPSTSTTDLCLTLSRWMLYRTSRVKDVWLAMSCY
eukprot:gene3221-6371_t